MEAAEKLGVALVGAGFMGEIHAGTLAKDPRAELRWVVDPTAAKANKVARQYRASTESRSSSRIRKTPELDDALADEKVGAVYLCTRPRSHFSLATACLKAGKAVFLEKPVTFTLAEARRLEKRAAQQQAPLIVGHVCRFFPEYVRIRDAVQAGDIGTPSMVRASRVMGNPGSWYADPKRSLGVPGDLMLHDIDLVLWMFGRARRAYAFSKARQPPMEEQHVLASLRHHGGTISHLEGSWAHGGGFRTRFEVSGSDGVLEFDSGRLQPLLLQRLGKRGRGSSLVVPESPSLQSPYDRQTEHFLDVVLEGASPRVTIAEAVHALEVALGVAGSARSGKPIDWGRETKKGAAR